MSAVESLEQGYPAASADFPAVLDGTVLRAGEAFIPATDDGLLRGDGAFEAVRVYLGHPFALTAHLDRLGRSCGILLLDCPRDELATEIDELVALCGRASYDLRIVVTRGGHRFAFAEPFLAPPVTARLGLVVDVPRLVLVGAKTLSYAGNMLARRRAVAAGGDEALLATPEGRVLEAQTAAFFFVDAAGRPRTPPLGEGILDSITRRVILGRLEVVEEPCRVDEVLACREAFLAGTRFEVRPVGAIDGRSIEAPGPVTSEVRRDYWRAVEQETGIDRREHAAYLERMGLTAPPLS